MKTVKELLNEADPLRHEPPISADRRNASRMAIIAAASAERKTEMNAPARFSRIAIVSIFALVIVFLGSRLMPHRGGFESYAFVQFEVRLAEDEPAPGLREAMVSGSGKTVYLHDEVVVNNSDVASAEVSRDENGRPAVSLRLTSQGGSKMGAASGSHLERPMAVLIDGVVVMAPIVKSTVTDYVMITGSMTKEDAERIVNGMK